MNVWDWNFATKLIDNIRTGMETEAAANNLPAPTDEQVRLEVDRVFGVIERESGNYVLRGPRLISPVYNQWWVEDTRLLTRAAAIVPGNVAPGVSFILPSAGNLTLSSAAPNVNSNVFRPPSANLVLSPTSGSILMTSGISITIQPRIVQVTVTGGPGNVSDWVGLYPDAAPAGSFVDWQYLNGFRSYPAVALTDATLTFTMPIEPGQYEFRFYPLDGFTAILAKTGLITVDPLIIFVPPGSPIAIVSADNAYYSDGRPYWAYNSVWGTPAGTAHTQHINVYSEFPNKTVFDFSFPNAGSPSGIWSYPSIQFGSTSGNGYYGTNGLVEPYGGVPPTPTQLNSLNLTVAYSVTLGDPSFDNNYDVIFDTFLTIGPPNGLATVVGKEISYFVYTPPDMLATIGTWTPLYASAIEVGTNVYNRPGSTQYLWVPPGGQKLSGTVDIGALMREAVARGIFDGTHWLTGMSFGPEVIKGSGSATIDTLAYTWL